MFCFLRQASMKFPFLLLQQPKWDYRHVPPELAFGQGKGRVKVAKLCKHLSGLCKAPYFLGNKNQMNDRG